MHRLNNMESSTIFQKVVQPAAAILALVVLLLLGWTTLSVIGQPDIGILWNGRGTVYYVKEGSPFRNGDVVLTIDGVPAAESTFPYYEWTAGDTVQFEIERDGERVMLAVPLVDQAPPMVLVSRLLINVVAFFFWIAVRQMVKHDKLIKDGKKDKIYDEMIK